MLGVGEEAGLRRLACSGLAAAALCAAAWPTAAPANDRPFLLTSTAVAEEDDDNVWAVETWWQRAGAQQVFNVAPEYAFNPTTSIQFQYARSNDHAQGLEVELKHLFNHIAREGWGWGVHVSLGLGAGGDGGAGWKQQGLALTLPYTLQLRDGDALLHVNAGVRKQRDERREWTGSLAFEHKVPWHSSLFVETGREDRQTLWHAGVRHWVRRDKLAIDVGVQQLRGGGEKASGVVVGAAWYDI